MFMKCENFLCVYEKGGYCELPHISLDINGMCTSCIYPNFNCAILKSAKEQTIKNMEY